MNFSLFLPIPVPRGMGFPCCKSGMCQIMRKIYQNLTVAQAEQYGLILTACGIAHHVQKAGNSWNIFVDAANTKRAVRIIDESVSENRTDRPIRDDWFDRQALTGVWISIGMIIIHAVIILSGDRPYFMRTYPSSAAGITGGEYYRTITALFLHAGSSHLMGNVAGLALFGSALCRVAGYGFGTFLILFSGGIGNLLNACMFGGHHISIGASTAVFGSIGALAGYRLTAKRPRTGPRQPSWLPLGGAVALLAILGTGGEHTDITAHLCGMASGLLLGIFYTSRQAVLQRPFLQKIALLIVIIVVAGSFLQGGLG